MHAILVLVRKDFANFFSNRMAIALTFLVPFALIWLFGLVFGVNRKDSGPQGIPLAVVNASADPAAVHLVEALQGEKTFKVITTHTQGEKARSPLREEDLKPLMSANKFRFALVIPADLLSGSQLGVHLRIYSNPANEIETQIVNGMLQKTISTQAPQLLGQSLISQGRALAGGAKMDQFSQSLAGNIAQTFGGDPGAIKSRIDQGSFGSGSGAGGSSLFSQLLRIETIQVAGKEVKSPAATRIVGGWAMQFLLFSLSAAATALFYERDRGIFHRILAGPVSRSQILWSKFIYGQCIGMVQLVTLFIGGRVLYGIDVEHHVGMLLLVCSFAAAACTAFGMLLAAVSPSPEAAGGFATLLILLMCSIGGAWFPVTLMPEFIQQASKFTLVYWALEGFSQVLWANAPLRDLLPTLGILGGMAAAAMTVAVWRFNRGQIFD